MKRFFAYLLLGILGTAAGIPYILGLLAPALAHAPFSTPILVLLIMGQTTIVIAVAVLFGLRLARATGFSTIINADPHSAKAIYLSLLLGVVTATLITLGDHFFARFLPNLTIESVHISTWKLVIVPLYGGIVEELLMRLFFVSLFAWIFARVFKIPDPISHSGLVWGAIILAAVLFGIGHLPATAALTPITVMVVIRAIVLNGIGGLVFGWLFWKKGLPYAMISHAATDLTMFVLLPSLLRLLSN